PILPSYLPIVVKSISMDNPLAAYLSAVSRACHSCDGVALANCFSLTPSRVPGGKRLVDFLGRANIDGACRNINPPEYGPVAADVLKALQAAQKKDHLQSFNHYQQAFLTFADGPFRTEKANWFMSTAHSMTRDIRSAAELADTANTGKGGAGAGGEESMKHVRGVANAVMTALKHAANDRNPNQSESKRAGSLYLANEMIKIYFQLNTLRNCKNIIATMDRYVIKEGNTDSLNLRMGDTVTYRFYYGRLKMFEDKYEEADAALSYALRKCHRSAVSNKRRILTYLIPIKLFLGQLPSDVLLKKYKLVQYEQVVASIRSGDLRAFNTALDKFQELFIRKGTFLLLEKVRALVYRTLFKKISRVAGVHLKGGKSIAVELGAMQIGLKLMGVEMDLDEIECILANLIYKGIVKGYISHKLRKLVLSAQDPFPFDQLSGKAA
ncbi:unnamed protein product, partial [Chrysoparadoxa australica]